MSLRLRLIGLVAIALVISLVVGGAVACLNASRSVKVEMQSALALGRRSVDNAVEGLQASRDPRHDLERAVALFRGNRHLRVSVMGDATAVAEPAVETSLFGEVPRWFVALIAVPRETDRVPILIRGVPFATILLETDPRNETLDMWNDFTDSMIVLALFSGQTMLLIYLFIGRALRPLYRLGAALERVGGGDYATRLSERPVAEMSRLHDSFNRMAARLAGADAHNRSLHEQLVALQEHERAEIARDLHDEVGPYLFAMNIDTAAASRLLAQGRAAEASDQLRLVTDAITHIRDEVRGVVRRLRPVGLDEFGLREAIGEMVRFWQRRHPDIEFRVRLAPECDDLGGVLDVTTYRIVQECVTNSLRHGSPTAITVELDRRAGAGPGGDDLIVLTIADDGTGMAADADAGFGLRGMTERVKAIGGRLTLRNDPGGGLRVSAALPCRTSEPAMPADAEARP